MIIASPAHRQAMGDYGAMLRVYRRHIIDAMLITAMSLSTLSRSWRLSFARRAVKIPVRCYAEREFGDSNTALCA